MCTVKNHRTHNCDLASDVIEKYKQQIKQQLDLLARKVEAIIEEVDSASEKVQDERDKTRQ